MVAESSWNVTEWFDGELRTATLLGLASIPATVALNWRGDPSSVSGEALFFACVLAGYLYADRPTENRHAGAQTALVGMIPVVVWWAIDLVGQPIRGRFGLAFVLVAGPIVIVVACALISLVGAVCAICGGWLYGLVDRVRAAAVGN